MALAITMAPAELRSVISMDADEIVDVESASPAAHLTEHEVIPRPRACTVLSPPGRLPEEVPPDVL